MRKVSISLQRYLRGNDLEHDVRFLFFFESGDNFSNLNT